MRLNLFDVLFDRVILLVSILRELLSPQSLTLTLLRLHLGDLGHEILPFSSLSSKHLKETFSKAGFLLFSTRLPYTY